MAFELQSSPEQTPPTAVSEFPQPTKPPPWKGLIVADLYLSESATGFFVVSAVGDLIAPNVFGPIARVGYLAAFPLILIDLICLVADLGDPRRFHHMLRVVNLRSPMSTGMWVLTIFAALSFICMCLAAVDLAINIPGIAAARAILGGIGIAPALFVGGYKGVMLSATAQPLWRRLRWLGAELVSSAILMGAAGLLIVALFLPVPDAVPGFVLAQKALLFVNLAFTLHFFSEMISAAIRARSYFRIAEYALLLCIGWILPLIFTFLNGAIFLTLAACLILSSAVALRYDLVMAPHRQS
jgi:Ni/Fe-hydrogenase subunit HybB-like protein